MAKISKRQKQINEKITPGKLYTLDEALATLKECSQVKFKESLDVSVMLGIDGKVSEQAVRAATVLPHGTGRTVKVAVFAQGQQAEAAKAAGADRVGMEDLAEAIKGGDLDFGVVIATPDAMRLVGQLGQILGPRGLMPNPKVGTVTADVNTAVKNAKSGQVRYRSEKAGIIHCTVGQLDFDNNAVKENLRALLTDLKKARPASAKGIYLRKIVLSSTMGPGLVIDQTSIES